MPKQQDTPQTPFESDDFKREHSEWMKKLKDSGFKDIETSIHQTFDPNQRHSINEAELIRYREILETYPFTEPIHRTIFEHFSEGRSLRTIEKLIDGQLKQARIHLIIREILGNSTSIEDLSDLQDPE